MDQSNYFDCQLLFNMPNAPVLYTGRFRDWLDGRTIVEAATGKSVINENKLREGIVVKPYTEQVVPSLGRLVLKVRDPIYLEKSGL